MINWLFKVTVSFQSRCRKQLLAGYWIVKSDGCRNKGSPETLSFPYMEVGCAPAPSPCPWKGHSGDKQNKPKKNKNHTGRPGKENIQLKKSKPLTHLNLPYHTDCLKLATEWNLSRTDGAPGKSVEQILAGQLLKCTQQNKKVVLN